MDTTAHAPNASASADVGGGVQPPSGQRHSLPGRAPAHRLGALALALASAWTAIAVMAILAALPPNPVQLTVPETTRLHVRAVVPQGWAFFTRSPREARLLPWVRSEDGWLDAHTRPHAEPRHVFGLDRASRAQGVELGLLVGEVTPDRWQSCEGSIRDCLTAQETGDVFQNPSPEPTICGAVGLIRREPLPWAWAGGTTSDAMPAETVRMDVQC